LFLLPFQIDCDRLTRKNKWIKTLNLTLCFQLNENFTKIVVTCLTADHLLTTKEEIQITKTILGPMYQIVIKLKTNKSKCIRSTATNHIFHPVTTLFIWANFYRPNNLTPNFKSLLRKSLQSLSIFRILFPEEIFRYQEMKNRLI
jgi:hypothetical protein